jgi:hypothetical protein
MTQHNVLDQLKVVFFVGVMSEILASFFLWLFSPTDSIGVWYPGPLAYIAEFLGVWLIPASIAGFVFFLASNALRALLLHPYLRIFIAGLTLVTLDVTTALLLWAWRPTLWPGDVERMLGARLTGFLVALVAGFYLVSLAWFLIKGMRGQPRRSIIFTLAGFLLPLPAILLWLIAGAVGPVSPQSLQALFLIGVTFCVLSVVTTKFGYPNTVMARASFAILVAYGWVLTLLAAT